MKQTIQKKLLGISRFSVLSDKTTDVKNEGAFHSITPSKQLEKQLKTWE